MPSTSKWTACGSNTPQAGSDTAGAGPRTGASAVARMRPSPITLSALAVTSPTRQGQPTIAVMPCTPTASDSSALRHSARKGGWERRSSAGLPLRDNSGNTTIAARCVSRASASSAARRAALSATAPSGKSNDASAMRSG